MTAGIQWAEGDQSPKHWELTIGLQYVGLGSWATAAVCGGLERGFFQGI